MLKDTNKNKNEKSSISTAIFKALITAFLITIIVFIVYALIITYTDISENSLQTVVIITTLFSVVTAGIITASKAEKSGWLYGMLVGLLYALAMILIGITLSPEIKFSLKTISTTLLSIAGGGVGGMIGINIGRK